MKERKEQNTETIQKELDLLKKELEVKSKQVEEYTNTLKRLQADFENYIKRAEKEKQELSLYSSAKVLAKVVNIVDDFERALTVGKEADKETLLQGLEMVYKEATKVLAEEGVKPLEAVGKKFDPYQHEIIDFKEADKEEGTVLEELQKGYLFKDKVLRPSRVRVSKGKENVQ